MGPLPHDHHCPAVGYSHSLQTATAPGHTSSQAPGATASSSPAGRTSRAAATTVAATHPPGPVATGAACPEHCIWRRALDWPPPGRGVRKCEFQKLLRTCCLPSGMSSSRQSYSECLCQCRVEGQLSVAFLLFLLLFLRSANIDKMLEPCLLYPLSFLRAFCHPVDAQNFLCLLRS